MLEPMGPMYFHAVLLASPTGSQNGSPEAKTMKSLKFQNPMLRQIKIKVM
jgi:hypothetical protein